MTLIKTLQEEARRLADEKFTDIRYGDGSPTGGGKGTYRVIKEGVGLEEIKDFYDSLILSTATTLINTAVEEIEKVDSPNTDRRGIDFHEGFYEGRIAAQNIIKGLLEDKN